ncbi:MAG: ankyrin repeat domain-containing protein [Rhodospirillales bacterium]|nr:ankyrin repeat domain-containing protein [Rhodospirillales bacterium]
MFCHPRGSGGPACINVFRWMLAFAGMTALVADESFLARGATANAKDRLVAPALMWAIGSGDEDCVRLLLESGADANVRDAEGVGALVLARRKTGRICWKYSWPPGLWTEAVKVQKPKVGGSETKNGCVKFANFSKTVSCCAATKMIFLPGNKIPEIISKDA